MCTQMTEAYPPPSYSKDYNSFLPPYYPSSTNTYTTTTPTGSFSSDQSAYDTQYPSTNQFSPFPLEASKALTDAYTYTAPPQLYTYAYLPPQSQPQPQPLYLNQQSPFPWGTLHPSPETPHINPQSLTAPTSKPPSPTGTNSQLNTIKRQRYLHKNRVAATKCRSKKKQYIQQLQSRFEDLSFAKRELQFQVQSLRNGLISLKEELVRHARCGDGPIMSYIEKRRAGCA